MKFHVNSNGEAGRCSATKGKCPFGGEDQHFSSADEARAAFEATMDGSFQDEASARLKELTSLSQGERMKNKQELRELYQEVTGLPISWDGYLFVGEEPMVYGQPNPTHLTKVDGYNGRYRVETEAIKYTDRGTTRRRLKSLSGRELTFDEAMETVTNAAKRYGVAEKRQALVNAMP